MKAAAANAIMKRSERNSYSGVIVVTGSFLLLLSASFFALYIPTVSAASGDTIVVVSHDMHTGAAVNGFFVDVRVNGNHIVSGYTPVKFTGLSPHVQYQVVVYWYGSYYFRHFSNGNLNRYALITFSQTGQTNKQNALYENVPSTQAASLNVIAEFPNGTLIGTSYCNNGYVQHTPGMWLTVAPSGQKPFTGSFTGGSILPFILFNGQTYTVQMTLGYKNIAFSHWQDNSNTNPSRTVTLNGNQSLTAIYVQTGHAAPMQPSMDPNSS